MTTVTNMDTYETRQVQSGYLAAMKRYDGDAKAAAASYGDDVKLMIGRNADYWDGLGLIRLYTRIAVRLACESASI